MKKSYYNTGRGLSLAPIDIGHRKYICVIEPDTAFWALIDKKELSNFLTGDRVLNQYKKKRDSLLTEMQKLRFNRLPQAVYLNPTEKCNLDCNYCYIPSDIRKNGSTISRKKLFAELDILKKYFRSVLPAGRKPEIIFHGSEPLLAKDNIFAAISCFGKDFQFGIQTNGTLLDEKDAMFIRSNKVNVGLSIDGHLHRITSLTRKTWAGKGIHGRVLDALRYFEGYSRINIICTVTKRNVRYLPEIANYFHSLKVNTVMLNPVRCTQQGGKDEKPPDELMAKYFIKAMDSAYKLYRNTGRKIVIANFANILISILAPTARKLMCDISPCGGGRCFFALSARGDIFPCSEFIGFKKFRGGNIFRGNLRKILDSKEFSYVTGRDIDNIPPCSTCAIRHFCGSPCPAEAYSINSNINSMGAFCRFYEEQVRYAFRLIADNKHEAFLWDNWDKDTKTVLNLTG